MGKQFLIWFLAALVGGVALWLAGSFWQYGGLPPPLINAVMSTHAGRSLAEKALNATAPDAPAGSVVLKVGDAVPPDYTLPDPHGQTHALAQWRGKRVLLNFWATWCIPCRKEMPALMAAQKAHDTDKVRIVGIAMDDATAVRAFLKQTPLNYPVLIGIGARPDPTVLFGDTRGALPYSVLIDASGRIVDTHLGVLDDQQLREWLR